MPKSCLGRERIAWSIVSEAAERSFKQENREEKGKGKKKERERERIVQGSDIIEDAEKKSRLRAVPGPVSRLMDAEQIVLTDSR